MQFLFKIQVDHVFSNRFFWYLLVFLRVIELLFSQHFFMLLILVSFSNPHYVYKSCVSFVWAPYQALRWSHEVISFFLFVKLFVRARVCKVWRLPRYDSAHLVCKDALIGCQCAHSREDEKSQAVNHFLEVELFVKLDLKFVEKIVNGWIFELVANGLEKARLLYILSLFIVSHQTRNQLALVKIKDILFWEWLVRVLSTSVWFFKPQ